MMVINSIISSIAHRTASIYLINNPWWWIVTTRNFKKSVQDWRKIIVDVHLDIISVDSTRQPDHDSMCKIKHDNNPKRFKMYGEEVSDENIN